MMMISTGLILFNDFQPLHRAVIRCCTLPKADLERAAIDYSYLHLSLDKLKPGCSL